MTNQVAGRRTIEVDADVYDVLASTATNRNTDINGAMRYLIEVPQVPTSGTDEDGFVRLNVQLAIDNPDG